MKFSAAINELGAALGHVSGAIPARSPMPVLENVLLRLEGSTLTVTATDMDITISTRLEVKGEREGAVLVAAKRFTDTVRALKEGELTFDADPDSNRVEISVSSGEYKLSGLAADEFPKPIAFDQATSFPISRDRFTTLVEKTIFACSVDEFRPAMTGVLFQFRPAEIRAVATDGFRLVRVIDKQETESISEEVDVIVPPKALTLAMKAFDADEIRIATSSTHIRFDDGTTTVTARLIDETYPNYESVIPQANDKRMIIAAGDLRNAVRRVSLYSNSQTRQVRLKMSGNTLAIAAQDVDTGGEAHEEVPCDYSDEELEIGFNANYVREALDRVETDEVTLDFSTPLRPSLIRPHGESNGQDVLMLLMPIRLNN